MLHLAPQGGAQHCRAPTETASLTNDALSKRDNAEQAQSGRLGNGRRLDVNEQVSRHQFGLFVKHSARSAHSVRQIDSPYAKPLPHKKQQAQLNRRVLWCHL